MKPASDALPVRVVLGLASAMSTGGIARAAVPAISVFLISDLEISASQFGLSVTLMIGAVAVGVPVFGQLSDRFSAKRVLVLRGAGAAGALLGIATAQSYAFLLLFQALLGLAISGGVPASNRVVAETVPLQFRGLAVGAKQSGATAGVLLAGLVIPPVASVWGWRSAMVVAALLSLMIIPAILWMVPRSRVEASPSETAKESWIRLAQDRSTRWLAAHGFITGMGIAMVFSFAPLYAVEEVGLAPAAAGTVLSAMSLMAIFARITWGRVSDMTQDLGRNLRLISALSVVAVGLIAIAAEAGAWSLWAGALVAGLSMEAWNSLAGSGIISAVPLGQAGRATSLVQLAFMAGNSAGPVVFGTILDQTGSFTIGWLVGAGLFVLATAARFRSGGTKPLVEGAQIVDRIEDR